jgi:hypothetical protein
MKKIAVATGLSMSFALCCLALAACGTANQGDSSSVSNSSSDSGNSSNIHVHNIVKMLPRKSTCSKAGNIEFYFCLDCKGYYLDENAEIESSLEGTRAPLLPHSGVEQAEVPATCGEKGVRQHWECSACGYTFADEECTERIFGTALELPSLSHQNMQHFDGYPVKDTENGLLEHWYCIDCDGYYLDELATQRVEEENVILYSAINIPDFVIEIPVGRDPVVLQLTDTQIIDGAQARPEHSSGDKITYATPLIKQYCYGYITETINATKPDLILLTGDIIYGAYDDNGSALQAFIAFMEEFKIPWAPVFGNHDNESKMGVDWQCARLEEAKYCLFEQKTLTGNGNYSVGIKQGGVLKRVFYMLDTNGCGDMSDESFMNGHTSKSVGFANDQIEWYTSEIERIKELSPETKISFAFHIQLAVFGEAFQKYGFNNSEKYQDIYIDYLAEKSEGDFGFLGRQMKDAWDTRKMVFNGMKALGADSIFVGHEHCNSASVVFEGVRLQYGQKSSEYDRYNSVGTSGKIGDTAIWKKSGTPLVGGSVIVLSAEDGAITNAYIYYCESAGANVDWSYYIQKGAAMQRALQQLMLGSVLTKKE